MSWTHDGDPEARDPEEGTAADADALPPHTTASPVGALGVFATVAFVVIPAGLLLLGGVFGGLLAAAERWSWLNGFLYVVSNLTFRSATVSPATEGGQFFDVLVAVLSLPLAGFVVGIVGNLTLTSGVVRWASTWESAAPQRQSGTKGKGEVQEEVNLEEFIDIMHSAVPRVKRANLVAVFHVLDERSSTTLPKEEALKTALVASLVNAGEPNPAPSTPRSTAALLEDDREWLLEQLLGVMADSDSKFRGVNVKLEDVWAALDRVQSAVQDSGYAAPPSTSGDPGSPDHSVYLQETSRDLTLSKIEREHRAPLAPTPEDDVQNHLSHMRPRPPGTTPAKPPRPQSAASSHTGSADLRRPQRRRLSHEARMAQMRKMPFQAEGLNSYPTSSPSNLTGTDSAAVSTPASTYRSSDLDHTYRSMTTEVDSQGRTYRSMADSLLAADPGPEEPERDHLLDDDDVKSNAPSLAPTLALGSRSASPQQSLPSSRSSFHSSFSLTHVLPLPTLRADQPPFTLSPSLMRARPESWGTPIAAGSSDVDVPPLEFNPHHVPGRPSSPVPMPSVGPGNFSRVPSRNNSQAQSRSSRSQSDARDPESLRIFSDLDEQESRAW